MIVVNRITMVSNRVMDVLRATVLLHQTAHSAMIIRANADVNRVSPDVHVIDVCQAIGIIHRKDVYVSQFASLELSRFILKLIIFYKFQHTACSCNNDYSRGVGCNVYTGQCECLPGVVGEKCDACPYRWVLVQDQGCHECDVCHHNLLDVTDAMANELDPVIDEFETVAGGFFTSQKLKYLDELAGKIEPDVRALDPNRIDLSPVSLSIDGLESEAKKFEHKLHYVNQTINDQLDAGSKLLNDSRFALTGTRKTLENIQNTVYEVQKLADNIDTTGTTKAEAAIAEANTVLNQLYDVKLDTEPTENQLRDSIDYLEKIENFVEPVKKQNNKLNDLKSGIDAFNDKLIDIKSHANEAIKLSWEADNLNLKNKNGTVNSKFDTVNNHTKETENNIVGTSDLKKQGDIVLGEIFRFLKNLENVNNQLKSINSQVEKDLPEKEKQYDALEDLIANASNHRTLLADTVGQSSDLVNKPNRFF